MAQIRYHDYLSEIRSKNVAEKGSFIGKGIGPIFGYNKAAYDGSNLILDSDIQARYNISNERKVLTNIRQGVITPDGIITVETNQITIPLNLGTITGYQEVFITATHLYEETEGGSPTTYNAYVNPTPNGDWGTSIDQLDADINTWLDLYPSLQKNTTAIIAYVKIGEGNSVTQVFNPYNYDWHNPASLDYVTWDELRALNYATQSWVNQQGFLKSADLNGYATESWVDERIGPIHARLTNSDIPSGVGELTPFEIDFTSYRHNTVIRLSLVSNADGSWPFDGNLLPISFKTLTSYFEGNKYTLLIFLGRGDSSVPYQDLTIGVGNWRQSSGGAINTTKGNSRSNVNAVQMGIGITTTIQIDVVYSIADVVFTTTWPGIS